MSLTSTFKRLHGGSETAVRQPRIKVRNEAWHGLQLPGLTDQVISEVIVFNVRQRELTESETVCVSRRMHSIALLYGNANGLHGCCVAWRRAWRALRGLVRDPERTELVFALIQALGGDSGERNYQRFRLQPEGRRLLYGRVAPVPGFRFVSFRLKQTPLTHGSDRGCIRRATVEP